jgi:AsmA protein
LINIQPKANLYEGQYAGNIQLNATGNELITSVDEKLTGIQAGPLLKDLIDDDTLEGTGNVSAKLTTRGVAVDEIMRSLSGEAAVLFKDGAINGINVGKILREAQARLKGQKLSEEQEVTKTDFAELSASFYLNNGIARNQDLSLKSPLLRVSGTGMVNYIEQVIDYVATVTIVGTTKGQGGKELEQLKGLPLDVKITGPFADPKFDVNLAAALKEKAEAKAKEKIEKAKEEQKEKLQQKLQEERERTKDKLEGELKERFKKLF